MPARKVKVKGGYAVRTPNRLHAKRTTGPKADAQVRLLNAVEHGWQQTGKKAKARPKKRSRGK